MNGTLADPAGVAFELDVRRPGWIADWLGGNLVGHGRYAPAADIPVKALQLSGSEIEWGDLELETLAMEQDAANDDAPLSVAIRAEGLSMEGARFDSADLHITGDRAQQDLTLILLKPESGIELGARGGLVDWTDPLGSGWKGKLTRFLASQGDTDLLSLSSPGALEFSADTIRLGRTCLKTAGEGKACVTGSMAPAAGMTVALEVEDLPLSTADPLFAHEFDLTQRLHG